MREIIRYGDATKAYINKVEQRIEKHRAEEVQAFLESEVDNDDRTS